MNLFGLGPTELIIIAVIVLVLFGPKRLPQIGKSLGQTMKAVKDGMEGELEEKPAEETAEKMPADAVVEEPAAAKADQA